MQSIQQEMVALKSVVLQNGASLVARCKSHVVHIGLGSERSTEPAAWRAKCGWQYGVSRFFRVPQIAPPYRPCRKCRQIEASSDSDSKDTKESRQSHGARDSSAVSSASDED